MDTSHIYMQVMYMKKCEYITYTHMKYVTYCEYIAECKWHKFL